MFVSCDRSKLALEHWSGLATGLLGQYIVTNVVNRPTEHGTMFQSPETVLHACRRKKAEKKASNARVILLTGFSRKASSSSCGNTAFLRKTVAVKSQGDMMLIRSTIAVRPSDSVGKLSLNSLRVRSGSNPGKISPLRI